MNIEQAVTDEQITRTWEVMHQLRPHITCEEYLPLVRDMMASEGYSLVAALEGERVCAVAGYRYMKMLYCGLLLYVDDLVTDEGRRSFGYGGHLLDWLENEARSRGCAEIQLLSRVTREQAHRFYFREGFGIECFEFRKKLQ